MSSGPAPATTCWWEVPATTGWTRLRHCVIGAAAAVDAGKEVAIVLLKESVILAWKGTQKADHGLGFSPIPDLIQKVVEANVPVYFESTSTAVLGIKEEDIMSLKGTIIDMVQFAELISESSVVTF